MCCRVADGGARLIAWLGEVADHGIGRLFLALFCLMPVAMRSGALVLIIDISRLGQGWARVGAEPIRWTVAGFGPSP